MGDGYDDYLRRATRYDARPVSRRPSTQVTARLRRGQIQVRGWLGPETPQAYRSVAGGQFHRTPVPHWTYPATLATYRALLRAFRGRIYVDDDLREWAKSK